MLGFLRRDAGTARILDHDCWRQSEQIKRQVGYVAGDVRLYPWLTARLGLGIVGQIRRCSLMADGLRLCEQFSLEPDLPVRKMSRGNRQKVALVLALAHAPRVVILDEPTSGLDPLMQLTLMQHLRALASQGTTVLFSSHTLSEVEDICDQVAMIRDGQIVVDESLDSLKRRAPRTIHIELPPTAAAERMTWPRNVAVIAASGTHAQLQLHGSSVEFLQWAASQSLVDLSISQPSLDVLFHAYYDLN